MTFGFPGRHTYLFCYSHHPDVPFLSLESNSRYSSMIHFLAYLIFIIFEKALAARFAPSINYCRVTLNVCVILNLDFALTIV